MGSVRLEESGEWSGGVPECRTAHAAHQQRVERGGAGQQRSLSFVSRPPKEKADIKQEHNALSHM